MTEQQNGSPSSDDHHEHTGMVESCGKVVVVAGPQGGDGKRKFMAFSMQQISDDSDGYRTMRKRMHNNNTMVEPQFPTHHQSRRHHHENVLHRRAVPQRQPHQLVSTQQQQQQNPPPHQLEGMIVHPTMAQVATRTASLGCGTMSRLNDHAVTNNVPSMMPSDMWNKSIHLSEFCSTPTRGCPPLEMVSSQQQGTTATTTRYIQECSMPPPPTTLPTIRSNTLQHHPSTSHQTASSTSLARSLVQHCTSRPPPSSSARRRTNSMVHSIPSNQPFVSSQRHQQQYIRQVYNVREPTDVSIISHGLGSSFHGQRHGPTTATTRSCLPRRQTYPRTNQSTLPRILHNPLTNRFGILHDVHATSAQSARFPFPETVANPEMIWRGDRTPMHESVLPLHDQLMANVRRALSMQGLVYPQQQLSLRSCAAAAVAPLAQVQQQDSFVSETRTLSLPAVIGIRATDEMYLSDHQVYLRQQIEVFAATEEDVNSNTRGRTRQIIVGQVGIRCRHCSHIPAGRRQQATTYFPAVMYGLYQAAQNMATNHIQCGMCRHMPDSIKEQFKVLIPSKKNISRAGRAYWANHARQLGLVDTDNGIAFRP